MPQTEDEVKDNLVSDSPAKITSWWNKFHFSGRVIMCSVLFGLGLVLIGGLIFAINVDDDTIKNAKDETAEPLPMKAPSNYVGPVVMGIGSFIVIVGVIMCLFETQVCRKKTGDATKPLISDKSEDFESKASDSTSIPQQSHYHKKNKHKCRKALSSPRKTKSKHAKSDSREQKQESSKSPPISIDKSKSYMTSSEENFLTPPNTLEGHPALVHTNSREVEIQTSSSLMKSFTSSGPSWNQSTEFLTPTASYKDNSISVDNSVELDEKQGHVNFEAIDVSEMEHTRTEYMTPLTAEDEKIQKMLIQVKNEHMKADKEQSQEKVTAVNVSSICIDGYDNVENENKIDENIVSKNALSSDVNFDTSALKETNKPKEAILDAFKKSNIPNEENTSFDNFSGVSNISAEELKSNKNEAACESSDMTAHTHKNEKEIDSKQDIACVIKGEEGHVPTQVKENHYVQDNGKQSAFFTHESSTSHINEVKNVPHFDSDPPNEKNNENNLQVDLASSVSSEETLISQDSSIEKPKNNDNQAVVSIAEENSNGKSNTSDISESLKEDRSSPNNSISDHRKSLTDNPKVEKFGASDLTDNENDLKETKNSDEKSS